MSVLEDSHSGRPFVLACIFDMYVENHLQACWMGFIVVLRLFGFSLSTLLYDPVTHIDEVVWFHLVLITLVYVVSVLLCCSCCRLPSFEDDSGSLNA